MFGSLMMFASGVVASAPSSASASACALIVGQPLRELGDDPPGEGDVAGLHAHAGLGREGLDDRQERVRRQQRRLVGAGVDDGGAGVVARLVEVGVRHIPNVIASDLSDAQRVMAH